MSKIYLLITGVRDAAGDPCLGGRRSPDALGVHGAACRARGDRVVVSGGRPKVSRSVLPPGNPFARQGKGTPSGFQKEKGASANIGIAGDLTYSLAQKSIPDGPDSLEKTNQILEEYDLQELIVS